MSHHKPTAVIKVGGDILLSEEQRQGLVGNVSDLYTLGWNIIILHGGGPQVNSLQNQLGHQSQKIAGRRITSKDDLKAVVQAIAGEVNVNLVSLLSSVGLPAFGCHGASGMLIKAKRRPPVKVSGGGDSLIDFGEVGDVQSINHQLLNGLLGLGQLPVIATLGMNDQGQIFNINADTTVIQIAKAVKAKLLLLITEVGGILRDINDPESLIPEINPQQAESLIKQGIICDGMIPKVEEAVKLLSYGIDSIAIASASQSGVFKALAKVDISTDIKATRISLSN